MMRSKPRRNELLKTTSLYLLLFTVVSMTTSALLVQPAAAHPEDCGIELNDLSVGFIYANGWDDTDTDTYNKYGLKAESLITNPSICGHFQTDGSVGGGIILMSDVGDKFIELGWFKGNYTDAQANMIALTTPHYFRGFKDSGGSIQYLDISYSRSIYPTVNHWGTFTLNGDPTPGYYTWNSTIESADHSTIVVTGATMPASYGATPRVMFEMHNNESSGTAHFKNISNAQASGGSLSWYSWGASYNNSYISPGQYPESSNPYVSWKISTTEFCMFTKPGSCP